MSKIATRLPTDPVRATMLRELSEVLESSEFVSAPIMRRLLEFLVMQTINNNGERTKAYTIAVEGLGRPEDFDPISDSYPRVQVGRLRKILEAHYAHVGDDSGRCLYIPRGAYEVRLARRSTAYPQLSLTAPQTAMIGFPAPRPEPVAMEPRPVELSPPPGRPFRLLAGIAGLLLFAVALVGATLIATKGDNCPILPFSSAPPV